MFVLTSDIPHHRFMESRVVDDDAIVLLVRSDEVGLVIARGTTTVRRLKSKVIRSEKSDTVCSNNTTRCRVGSAGCCASERVLR